MTYLPFKEHHHSPIDISLWIPLAITWLRSELTLEFYDCSEAF